MLVSFLYDLKLLHLYNLDCAIFSIPIRMLNFVESYARNKSGQSQTLVEVTFFRGWPYLSIGLFLLSDVNIDIICFENMDVVDFFVARSEFYGSTW